MRLAQVCLEGIGFRVWGLPGFLRKSVIKLSSPSARRTAGDSPHASCAGLPGRLMVYGVGFAWLPLEVRDLTLATFHAANRGRATRRMRPARVCQQPPCPACQVPVLSWKGLRVRGVGVWGSSGLWCPPPHGVPPETVYMRPAQVCLTLFGLVSPGFFRLQNCRMCTAHTACRLYTQHDNK